jgi:hypothetical protein
VARRISDIGFVFILILTLLSSTLLNAQQTQKQQTQSSGSQAASSGQRSAARGPSSSYNRMGKSPADPRQQTTQAQQFPGAAGQFPPDQRAPAVAGQRPPITSPQTNLPAPQGSPQPQANQAQAPLTQPAQQNPAQPAPQTPTGPAQQPANPPRISYVGGLLTIAAENSSLRDILKAVQGLTHAELEGTQPSSERVFGQFGPGTPRDVLNSLLNGSHYDFILVGAVDDPGGVDRIMLSPRANSPGNGPANQTAARQNNPAPNQEVDEDNDGVAQVPEPQPPQPQQQPPMHAPPGQQQVKTPEQLLEELQRLRQQQQQQQQQPNGPR